MKEDSVVLFFAVMALTVSIVAAGITYFSVSNIVTQITGLASTGIINLTVETSAAINFSTALVTWNNGTVGTGCTKATLTSYETNNVTCGNWVLQPVGGLRIENVGNVNISMNITVGKNASNFISGAGAGYEINITNSETSACTNGTFAFTFGKLYVANTSGVNGKGVILNCNPFQYISTADVIRLDFNLTIPETSSTGLLQDTITASAYT